MKAAATAIAIAIMLVIIGLEQFIRWTARRKYRGKR
jgi:hypothetical protein